ncbi:MAG: DUF4340 domain-containing protein [Verrucomicrobiota bacterium]
MRTKVTLALIFLNVALFFFIFKFERAWRVQEQSLETRRRVLGPEAADIRTLTITNNVAGTSVSLSRQRDVWSLVKPLSWPADQHVASSIANELHLLEHLATFSVADAEKNKQPLSDYGLEKPRFTIEFTSGEPAAPDSAPRHSTRLLVGDTTPDQKRLYILSPDGQRVYVVNRSLLDTLSAPLEKLRAEKLLSIQVFETRSLSIQTADIRARILRDGQRWQFSSPHSAKANKTLIELTINALYSLQARTFNPTPAPATLPSSAPTLRVTIEGNNRQETLYLGEPVPTPQRPAAAATPAATEFYAQLEGRTDVLFTVAVPAILLDTLRNAHEALRDKRFLDFDPATVTAVTIAAPVQPNQSPITLQRLESAPGQSRDAAEPVWQVVHRSEGTSAPQTLPADPAAIRSLLQRLSLLTADSFKSDAPATSDLEEWGFNRPVREITLTFSGGPPPAVLRIGTDSARNVHYARVGTATEPGASVYTVTPSIVGELPLAPAAWRSRLVGEPVPPAARISALKLTDLAENKILAAHTFSATGEATPPPKDLKALLAIVGAVRTLRAREFLPGGFTEKVFAAGDDRPWRFQLETTIALPVGNDQEQTRTTTLLLTERLGGALQYGGSKDLGAVFALEQPFVDALWSLAYGDRDPGPPDSAKK